MDVSLCDFGMAGYIDKECSLPNYSKSNYRDIENINNYP